MADGDGSSGFDGKAAFARLAEQLLKREQIDVYSRGGSRKAAEFLCVGYTTFNNWKNRKSGLSTEGLIIGSKKLNIDLYYLAGLATGPGFFAGDSNVVTLEKIYEKLVDHDDRLAELERAANQ